MDNDKIECCRTRKCGWNGLHRDLVRAPSKNRAFKGIVAHDLVCPKCGCREHYVIERATTGDSSHG